jgi:predicted aspartyl protease
MQGASFSGVLAALLVVLGASGSAPCAERFGDSVPMQQRASGNYYVVGTLTGGVQTDFLVDTGSGYVSLAPAVFERLRAASGTVFLRDFLGTMANGRTLKVPLYRIETLELSPHCVLHDVEVTVMPGSTRNILGLSALRRVAPFALDLEPALLMLSGCEQGIVASAADTMGGVAMRPSAFTEAPASRTSAGLARP